MSRGLGYLQRAILENLEESRQSDTAYIGAAFKGLEAISDGVWGVHSDIVKSDGEYIRLPDDVYDMRKLKKFLGIKLGHGYGKSMHGSGEMIDTGFEASFSRAVKRLCELRYLHHFRPAGDRAADVIRRFVRRLPKCYDSVS